VEDDFDLDGLSEKDAAAYVAGFITTQKQAAADLASAEDELNLWKKRTALATERGETELARQSLARAEEAHLKVVKLRSEKNELDFKVTELKSRLSRIRRNPEFTVNAEALAEQLGDLVGDQETAEAIRDAEAELALEELKKKMESQGDD